MVDSASCDIIDLTADDEEVRLGSRHAAETEPASRQGFGQPHPVQCKADSGQPAALPEQDMPHQQGSLSGQAETSAQQAGVRLQHAPTLPDQATLPEPARAGNASQAEASSTSRHGGGQGELPLPLGEGFMQADGGQPPLPLRDKTFEVEWGEAALPLTENFVGVDGGQPPLPPLPLGEGVMRDLCMVCAYGMDLAALVDYLMNQVDMWPGIPFA